MPVSIPSTAPAVLEPISREKTLGETVYHRLRRALMSGVFPPGRKITVRSVAAELKVSITPARDALSRLISEGALENQGPKTVIVPELSPEILKEVTAIRLALEGLAAESATAHFSKADIADLARTQEQLVEAMDRQDYRGVLHHNELFHFGIYSRAEMPRLLAMIESLWLRTGPSLNLLYPEFSVRRRGVNNHREILAGLKAGDAKRVRAAMEQDIRDGYVTLSAAVEQAKARATP